MSLAIALCEGVITRVGRIWADGQEIERESVNLRVYTGTEDQLPDPKISIVEGEGTTPAFRGIAYVVLEDLDLGRFGNRVPQFAFEVIRPAKSGGLHEARDLRSSVSAVALMPGTGEFALSTTRVYFSDGPGVNRNVNVNAPTGMSDFSTSLEHLVEEAPKCQAASLVVSWFGDDLRAGFCTLRPKVEQNLQEALGQAWRAGGISRAQAEVLPQVEGRVVYGGTPGDASVIEAIVALRDSGQAVMFYPFILMEQLAENGLPDPWSSSEHQPVLPWRGRITVSTAPGRAGSPDRSLDAEAEVAQFFGTALASDFLVADGVVTYNGPQEWSYRRFILHYAHLCTAAGGVDAFCIGSELRALTQIRGGGDSFPSVAALRALAADVREILGQQTKISYAADWSEYFGYNSPEGNRYFHLDPLWADDNIDFIGIDNYMPLSDWRDGASNADKEWSSIYYLQYLKANVAGGEGYDWYYEHPEADALQIRTPIVDGAFGEDWIWRYKDLRGWWSNPHHDRIDGERLVTPSQWVPGSKPFWFTELGCAAVDKGTNQPNVFLDPKSSESKLPKGSNGRRDDFIQMQYLRAMTEYWGDDANNPQAELYEGSMVEKNRMFVWAWDARPFPQFPGNRALWSDGGNYARGHWLNGRITNESLAAVVAEICENSGIQNYDVSGLYGVVRGFLRPEGGTARSALQPLMLAYGFEAVERDGVLRFQMRDGRDATALQVGELVSSGDSEGDLQFVRASEAEVAGRVRIGFVEAEADFDVRSEEEIFPDEESYGVAQGEVNLTLTRAEGRSMAQRWLAEARIARDAARFSVPPSRFNLGAGDVVDLGAAGLYRIDRAETALGRSAEAVRIEPSVYQPSDEAEDQVTLRGFVSPVPVFPLFMDLPLMSGREDPISPHVAVSAVPWPGAVAVWDSGTDFDYSLNKLVISPSLVGVTETVLPPGPVDHWDRGPMLRVRLARGAFASADLASVLNGANLVAIGDGSSDRWELIQFATASPVDENVWDIGWRLRGLMGTDIFAAQTWPVGSYIVVLDRTVTQMLLDPAVRGLARHYRLGVAARGYDDPSVTHRIDAFSGIGLRPYRPAHLRVHEENGHLRFVWTRRGRIDADAWANDDIPLGEVSERYRVRIMQGEVVLRAVDLTSNEWMYDVSMQTADGHSGAWRFEVAQISESFGVGPYQVMEFDD